MQIYVNKIENRIKFKITKWVQPRTFNKRHNEITWKY